MMSFRSNFFSQASSAILRDFFLLPLVRYTLTFFKECLPLPFESQETTAKLQTNLAAAGRELLSISQTLPGLLDVEIIRARFLQKLATRTILFGHSRSPSFQKSVQGRQHSQPFLSDLAKRAGVTSVITRSTT